MPGNREDKFKEYFASLFIEGVKAMKDPKLKLHQLRRWSEIGLRTGTWEIILKNSEDHEEKKNQGQIKQI